MSSVKSFVQLKEKYDRVVALIDMDCFYCQVEEFLDPKKLTGKPIAVCQYQENSGIIAVNYPARALGVTRHMREKEAKAMCKELICVKVPSKNGKADLTKYRDAGYQVAKVLQTFTPLLERASVDEAYLDITDNVVQKMQELRNNTFQLQPANFVNTFAVGYESIGLFVQDVTSSVDKNYENVPEEERKAYASSKLRLLIGASIVNEIRRAVKDQTQYECSAGISHNKILAKLTAGFHKPNKQTILPIESISTLFYDLAVNKVKTLGGKLGEEVCSKLNAKTMSDILKYSDSELQQHFQARVGSWLYLMARGIDLEKVTPKFMSKSIAVSKNFRGKNEIASMHTLKFWLKELSKEIVERLAKDEAECNRTAKHMTVSFTQGEAKVDGKNVSSSRTVPLNGNSLNSYTAEQIAEEAFDTIKRNSTKFLKAEGTVLMSLNIKLLGITAGKFEDNASSGTSKNLQDLLKNHQKREVKKSPPQAGPSKVETSLREETSPMSRSAAISAIKMFERRSPKVMIKVPLIEKIVQSREEPETEVEKPEDLQVSTSFIAEHAIKGIKTLKHWIAQLMQDLCRKLENESDKNHRAPTEITISYKQLIDGKSKESVLSFPLEGFTDDLIDVEVFVATLKRSEHFMTSDDSEVNPIFQLEVIPSFFEDGKEWKYAMKSEIAVTPAIEEELQQDSEPEASNLEEIQQVLEPGKSNLEEIQQVVEPRESNLEEIQQNAELEASKVEEVQRIPEPDASNFVEVQQNIEPTLSETAQDSNLEEMELGNDSEDEMRELVRNEQQLMLSEIEESEKSLQIPLDDDQPVSPAYDATTDEEDIFEELETEETPEMDFQDDQMLPEESKDIAIETTSHYADTAGPSYMKTYAEFQTPLIPCDLLNPKEPCLECGKMIGRLDMVAHLDHHLAFQIANQQREEYRQQQKSTSSQSIPKKVVKPKTQQSKTPQNLIQKYVIKKENSTVDDETAENKIQCEQCQKLISNDDYVSHLDYHFAQTLRRNDMKKAAPKVEVKRPSGKRPGSAQKNLPKMKSMKAYLTQNQNTSTNN